MFTEEQKNSSKVLDRLSGPSILNIKLNTFPRRAWILIRPALQTAVFLPLRRIRCMGTSESGVGTEPVMAELCQKWSHLCQFEIKEQFIVWPCAASVLSNLLHLRIFCGPLVCFCSCKWNVSLLIWGFSRLHRFASVCLLLSYPKFSVCCSSGSVLFSAILFC